MGNVTIRIGLDNRVQPGEQTVQEILATLQAQGENPNAANPIKDPLTGKLLGVDLNLPESASAKATAAVDGHGGKASSTGPIPDPLLLLDLDAAAGMVFSQVLAQRSSPNDNGQQLRISAIDLLALLTPIDMGRIRNDAGTGNDYVDIAANATPTTHTHTVLRIDHQAESDGSSAVYLQNSGDLVLKRGGGQTIPVVLVDPISFPTNDNLKATIVEYWVDDQGRLYEKFKHVNGITILNQRSYDLSVQAGRV